MPDQASPSPNTRSGGGAVAVRGFVVQTLVALLDMVQASPPFTEITLEPGAEDEQFDFTGNDADGGFAVQVKSTGGEFQQAEVQAWARGLKAKAGARRCKLVLVGFVRTSVGKTDCIDGVRIEKKNLDEPGLLAQAAHLVGKFIEAQGLGSASPASNEQIVDCLFAKLLFRSTSPAPLSRAWLCSHTGPATGPDSAQADLDEAWETAERGPMPLFMADIHLHRARLFASATPYPWQSPAADLKEARRLIEKHGYQRRMEELQDTEAVLLPQSASR